MHNPSSTNNDIVQAMPDPSPTLSSISTIHYTCLSSLSSVSIPTSPGETLSHPNWRQVMNDEMCTLQSSGAWELVHFPAGKLIVGC